MGIACRGVACGTYSVAVGVVYRGYIYIYRERERGGVFAGLDVPDQPANPLTRHYSSISCYSISLSQNQPVSIKFQTSERGQGTGNEDKRVGLVWTTRRRVYLAGCERGQNPSPAHRAPPSSPVERVPIGHSMHCAVAGIFAAYIFQSVHFSAT